MSAVDRCWVDGRFVAVSEPVVRVDDGAFAGGRGCYTSARWTGRRARHQERHVARLVRDARALGIGDVDPALAHRAIEELGRAAFADGCGVVRVQASRTAEGRVMLVARGRPLGPEPGHWRAISLPFAHAGGPVFHGAKISNRLLHTLGSDAVREAGVDEGLFFDADGSAGRLVEGTRTNLVSVGADGVATTPPDARGAVAGIALEVVDAVLGPITRADRTRGDCAELREIIALNAVRGACAITVLDGRPVGSGRPGPLARELSAALDGAD